MTAREPPLVTPLTDAAVSRIERGVFAALDRDAAEWTASWGQAARPRWRGRVIAVLASAAVALAVIGVRQLRRAPGLPAHDARIATASSPSHLTVEGAAIDVAPSSAITFADEHDGATVIRLERGTVTCEVAPRGDRPPFVVEAGTTRITVVGTGFGVTRTGDHAQVWVAHGTVEVADDGVVQLVHAGERYVPDADSAVAQAETPPPLENTASDSHTDDGPPMLAPARSAEPPLVPVVVPVVVPVLARSAAPAPEARARRALAALALSSPPPVVVARAPDAVVPAPAAARAPDLSPLVISSAALRERFQSAAALEVRDPLAAFRIYRELASGSGPWAANALFAEARLSAERGQRNATNALLSAYLERFPRGPNAADARALLVRVKGGADGALR